jgi:tRNA nucleotidyltransferase (CCA-adding enzyme)
MNARWEHFDDERRTGLRGFGSTIAEAFEQVALAFTATMADPGRVGAWEAIELHCKAEDADRLLSAWLGLLADYAASRQILFSRLEVRIDGAQLSARAWGEQMDLRHRGFPRVAGAHGAGGALLSVARHGDGWVAQASVEFVPAPTRASNAARS